MASLITTEQLYEWFECKQQAKLVQLLTENQINFKYNAHGRPITTLEAINDSLRDKQTENEVDF